MSDYLVKSLAYGETLRIYTVVATDLVKKAQELHDTWSASSAAFGRSLIGTLLLSSAGLQDDDKMTVKIFGGGPVGKIVVDGNAHGTVKGYLDNPHVNLPLNANHKIDVKKAVGSQGFLAVTKDLGLKEPFTGQVPLISGELGEDFTYYLAKSEQIPSAVGLSVFVNADNSIGAAGGFLIQALPGADDAVLAKIEERLKEIPLVSKMILDKMTPEDILHQLFPDDDADLKILSKTPVAYKCDCSKERFADALASLPKSDIEVMIDEDHGCEAQCHFCNKKYHFSESELRGIAKHARQSDKQVLRHDKADTEK